MPNLLLEYHDGSSFTIGVEIIGRAEYVDKDSSEGYDGPTYGAYATFRLR